MAYSLRLSLEREGLGTPDLSPSVEIKVRFARVTVVFARFLIEISG